ncbi:sugar phosphate isomerase/epimerase family protein [Paenibacillus dendritiformis]|uniref:sugar phosphate isomerase/epimerase family protein n=1 Tax=Paenibacillus dendritiformis TaxID=130049 RepID=UPI00365A2866
MKIAVFSGTMMEYSLHQAMEIASRLGFEGIEIACREPHLSPDSPPSRVEEIRALADRYGLFIPALAGYMGHFSEADEEACMRALDEVRKLLKHAERLGAGMLRIFPGGPNAFLAQPSYYEKAARWLRRCAEEAEGHGKRIVLEIHNGSLIETADDALRLLNLVGAGSIGIILDAGNMYIADTDYGRDSVLKLGRHLFHIHVKDEKRIEAAGAPGTFVNRTRHGEESFLQCRLGEGETDHRELFAALRDTGYNGWITLETAAPYPPEERLLHDLAAVRRLLGLCQPG